MSRRDQTAEDHDDRRPQTIDGLASYMERRMSEFEDDLGKALAAVQIVLNKDDDRDNDDPIGRGTFHAQVWCCKGCGVRLALIDPDTEEIRIRHRGMTVYMTSCYHGIVRMPCRTCGYLNELPRLPPIQIAESKASSDE